MITYCLLRERHEMETIESQKQESFPERERERERESESEREKEKTGIRQQTPLPFTHRRNQ